MQGLSAKWMKDKISWLALAEGSWIPWRTSVWRRYCTAWEKWMHAGSWFRGALSANTVIKDN